MFKKKIAIVMTIGALSLTGCSLAPTPDRASAPSPVDRASSPSPAAHAAAASAAAPATAATASAAASAPGTAPAPAAAASAPASAPGTTTAPAAPASGSAAAAPAASAPAVAPAAATAAPAAAPAASPAAAVPTGDGAQAATALGWGPVLAGDEFSNTGAPDPAKWSVYNGAGQSGKGVRSPQAWNVANGVATVSGDSAGTTGGMSAKFAQQKYGRWETRMKTNARDPQYHPVLILWPNKNASANCAEVDYGEGSTDTAKMKFFLHYACGGADFQTTAAQPVDTTQWHDYAVEWTPAGITGYIDGVKTFTDTNPAHQPSVGMHQTLQLDWFPNGGATAPSQMQVDWVRVYK